VLSAKFDDPGALHAITPDEPLHEAVAKMKRNAVSQLPVLTREGSPVGSLWEGMVIDLMVQGKDTRAMTVREAMAEPFPIMEMETPIAEAARHFGQRVPAILVRRQEGDYAIITKHDLLQGLTS
jgi:predicted transcriptional regulator